MTEWIISLGDKVIKRFNIKEGWSLTIGRGAESDVIVDNTAISRQHTSIQLRDDSYMLTDLGSLNGTFVNGERIGDTVFVSNRDDIKLGKFKLAIAKDDENSEASIASYGVHPDTEDKTIIINPNKMSTMSKGSFPDESDHQLVRIEGNAVPNEISLKGKGSIKIGKGQSCDMIISGFLIADSQCYIVKHDDGFKIVPQRSWAKIYLNGTKIKDEQVLRKGDIIKIRSTKIRFH